MKVDIDREKYRLASQAENSLKRLIPTYNSNDLESLSSICEALCIIKEFALRPENKLRFVNFVNYLDVVYDKHHVLTLSYNAKYYSYTRNNIIKFIRGEGLHGDSKINRSKNPRDKALHDFVFPNDHSSTAEFVFLISMDFIVGPNIKSSSGNRDSDSCLSHTINKGGETCTITTIESIALFAAYEFWQKWTGQTPVWSRAPVILEFDPGLHKDEWGIETVQNILSQKGYWQDCIAQLKQNR